MAQPALRQRRVPSIPTETVFKTIKRLDFYPKLEDESFRVQTTTGAMGEHSIAIHQRDEIDQKLQTCSDIIEDNLAF